ncbi:hypothetical protein RF11_04806 [Thelohanellus kitauei]|uniref:Uncharacterized protein n=1 Tax=Thelohanellus kitauei TaxID=669202 RepID=A0A0C2JTX0_THEKT|nr:hypothetical protein RF11_04806 [Thelohanellus kitauei]
MKGDSDEILQEYNSSKKILQENISSIRDSMCVVIQNINSGANTPQFTEPKFFEISMSTSVRIKTIVQSANSLLELMGKLKEFAVLYNHEFYQKTKQIYNEKMNKVCDETDDALEKMQSETELQISVIDDFLRRFEADNFGH